MREKYSAPRRIDPKVQDAIVRLVQDHGYRTPGEVAKRLEADGLAAPSAPTIRSLIMEHTPKDPGRPWSLADAVPEDDSAFLVECLRTTLMLSAGRVLIPVAEAKWLSEVHRAKPTLAPYEALWIARHYLLA